jgi:DNA polymerase III alpha subunit
MTRALNGDIRRRVDSSGRVWFSGEDAAELLLRGYDITALHIDRTPDIEVYNHWCDKMDKTSFAISTAIPDPVDMQRRIDTWWITTFHDLAVKDILLQRCNSTTEQQRVMTELDLFEARGLIPVLRLMFMLVDHFRRNNIVWGVGRGSSVSSFCLYLIGVHRIHSLKYGLDISEFLRN